MDIIYISSACYPINKKEIDKTANKKLENNIIKFHNTIIDGLAMHKEIENVFSLIGLPISRKTNKKLIWFKKKDYSNKTKYIQFGFVNLPIFKQIIIAIKMYKYIKKIVREKEKDKVIIIYDASFVTVIPWIINFAKKNNIKSIGIFADIYDYMYDVKRKSGKSIFLRKIFIKKLNKTYEKTNGYIFLTESMNKLVNKNSKPYMIMEGIIKEKFYSETSTEKYNKTILYAGGLNIKYGVKNMVEAIIMNEDQDIKLHIYGDGELKDYISNIDNKKIKYYGVVDNEKILEEEAKATLLINPRFSKEEYTKYSFPSKIMEYMISGTPVLTTKLEGIPNDYYKYVYTIEDESVQGMEKTIKNIITKDLYELNKKGKDAQKFILENKNNSIQTRRIIKLINKL